MINAKPAKLNRPIDTSRGQVLTADPDIIKYDVSQLPPEIMASLILQDIGGTEFILVSRHDNIAGKNVDDKIIKNLGSISTEFGPKTLGALRSNVRGSKYSLPLSKFVDDSETTIDTTEESVVVLLTDIPYGVDVEVIVEGAADLLTW